MRTFEVEDDLIEIIWKRANPQPFEELSFSDALRRVLALPLSEICDTADGANGESLDDLVERLLANSASAQKKAPSPSPSEWANSVPELRATGRFPTWKAICDELGIDPAGDSARRKLKAWAEINRPGWPPVPQP